jgi:hypothetical protein
MDHPPALPVLKGPCTLQVRIHRMRFVRLKGAGARSLQDRKKKENGSYPGLPSVDLGCRKLSLQDKKPESSTKDLVDLGCRKLSLQDKKPESSTKDLVDLGCRKLSLQGNPISASRDDFTTNLSA